MAVGLDQCHDFARQLRIDSQGHMATETMLDYGQRPAVVLLHPLPVCKPFLSAMPCFKSRHQPMTPLLLHASHAVTYTSSCLLCHSRHQLSCCIATFTCYAHCKSWATSQAAGLASASAVIHPKHCAAPHSFCNLQIWLDMQLPDAVGSVL